MPIAWHVDGVKMYRNPKAWIHSYSSVIKKKHDSLTNKMVLLLVRGHILIKAHRLCNANFGEWLLSVA